MTDQLISFETAKLAKEKGFTNPETRMSFVISKNIYWNGKNINRDEVPYLMEGCDFVLQPAQSLLQRWLREVKLFSIQPFNSTMQNEKTYGYHIHNLSASDIFEESRKRIYHMGTFATYEEALEAALVDALKLI